MKPYYEHGRIVIYHADWRDCELEQRGLFDLLLTDPPYGIKAANGMGGGGIDGFGKNIKRQPRYYAGKWDNERPDSASLQDVVKLAQKSIIWGGNYFADVLPLGKKWLVWDKCNTMPTFSDSELAWTNLEGTSVKMLRLNGSGLMAVEQDRWHPTQKPLALMKWCIVQAPTSVQSVLDPYMGSGTTLIAAKAAGMSAIGCEREEQYCESAAVRLSQEIMEFA